MTQYAQRLATTQVQFLDRSVPVLLIALIALAGTGTAAVLSLYGTVGGTAAVHQAVLVNGNNVDQQVGSTDYQATFSYNVTGGELGQSTFTLQNNANEPATVHITTDETGGPQGNPGQGLSTSHIVYDQWTLSHGDSTGNAPSVAVEATEQHNTAGDYAIRFTSSGPTSDYARVFFPATDLDGSENLTYLGTSRTDHPVDDEVWLITENGDQFYTHGATTRSANSGTGLTHVTYDLDQATWYNTTQHRVTPDFSEVVAVGIGQGAPADPNSTVTVATTIDNIHLGSGGPITEQAQVTMPLLSTGTGTHPVNGTVTTRYRTTVVTSFAINVYPGDYTLATTIAPVTS